MYYYFYKITNNINNKYYYGVHHTENLDDGYMGSGKIINAAYDKYGKSNFTKEIIKFFDNSEDMYAYEAEVVNADTVNDKNCYNIAIRGHGGNLIEGLSEEEYKAFCEKMSVINKQKYIDNPELAKHHSEKMKEYYSIQENKDKLRDIMLPIIQSYEYKKKMSESTSGEKNGMYGKHHSNEAKKKMSDAITNYYKEPKNKEKFLNSLKSRGDEWRKHISESKTGKKHGPRSEETKKKIGDALRGRKRPEISKKLKGRKNPKISEALRGKPSGTSGKHWKLVDGKRYYYK